MASRPSTSTPAPVEDEMPRPRASIKDGDLHNPMELGDFMSELGVVMRLPKRELLRALTPKFVQAVADQLHVPARARPILPIVAAAVVIGFVGMQFRPAPVVAVPVEITGTWETTDPRYPGRQLVLSEKGVLVMVIAKPEGGTEVVRKVTSTRIHDTLSLVLTYGATKPFTELAVAYVRRPNERLILRNPAGVVWTRTGAQPGQPAAGGSVATNQPGGAH